MNKKCRNCRLVNFPNADTCSRCQLPLAGNWSVDDNIPAPRSALLRRTVFCILVCLLAIIGFYLSLVVSAKSLRFEEKRKLKSAIGVLTEQGFTDEVFFLETFT